jgi:GNAT superfamily N-acetyltransferase
VQIKGPFLEHRITKYPLEQGALEIEYIEEYFGEYKRRKQASEIVARLQNRDHLILMAMAPLPDDPGTVVPVSYKVAHEIRAEESIPKLADLVQRLRDYVNFNNRRILYTWIGGTRRDWRGQGHFRALTEQQEAWAIENGFDEILVKTKNRFYEMRGTLDHLHFNVVKYEPHADNQESKVYLSKRLGQEVLDAHRSMRKVVTVGD